MTTLVWGVNFESVFEARTPQPYPPSSCLNTMPPNDVSWTTLFSITTSLNQVLAPLCDCTSKTMPPVRFGASQPVWNLTHGGSSSAVSPPIQLTTPLTSWTNELRIQMWSRVPASRPLTQMPRRSPGADLVLVTSRLLSSQYSRLSNSTASRSVLPAAIF